MNFAGNFNVIGRLEVGGLRQQVLALPESRWQGEPFRQQRYEIHRDTQTISLVFDPDFRHTHPTRLPALQEFEQAIRPALAMAAGHFDDSPAGRALREQFSLGYFVRANLVRLRPGGQIASHKDNNFSLTHSHRVHVPIVTNAGVTFTVGGETRCLEEGDVVEINNRRMHAVRNDGDEHRVHLIVDYVRPGERCCCGQKLRPSMACNPHACQDTDRLQTPCDCLPEHAPAN